MILNLSINKSMINKANPSLYGWKNAEMTGEELADHIHNGFAFAHRLIFHSNWKLYRKICGGEIKSD